MFAAYKKPENKVTTTEEQSTKSVDPQSSPWLKASSYEPGKLEELEKESSRSIHRTISKRSHKKSTHLSSIKHNESTKIHKSKTRFDSVTIDSEFFRLDHKPVKDNLAFKSTHYSDAIKYDIRGTILISDSISLSGTHKKTISLERYFSHKKPQSSSSSESIIVRPLKNSVNFVPITSNIAQTQDITPSQGNSDDKLRSLNSKLTTDPKDISKWIELAFFNPIRKDEGTITGPDESLPVLERRLAVIEQALTHNPSSIILRRLKIKASEKLWSPKQVINEWESLAFVFPSDMNVAMDHISFLCSTVSVFSFRKVMRSFKKYFLQFISIYRNVPSSENFDKVLHLFSHYVQFLKSSGYTERAIACLQAVVHINLIQEYIEIPSSLDEIKRKYGNYWNSGRPRLGEPDFRLLENFSEIFRPYSDKKADIVLHKDLDDEEINLSHQCTSEASLWMKIEELREFHHWLPFQGNPDLDPERTVIYDDISYSLFVCFKNEHRNELLDRFMQFLGISTRSTSQEFLPVIPSNYFYLDAFISASFGTLLNSESIQNSHGNLLALWMEHKRKSLTNTAADLKIHKKWIKSILAKEPFRSNAVLYVEYARFEWLNMNKREESIRIFTATLSTQLDANDTIHLVYSYLRLELLSDILFENVTESFLNAFIDERDFNSLKERCMRIFVKAFADKDLISAANLLKARNKIFSDDFIPKSDSHSKIIYIRCVFTYLTDGIESVRSSAQYGQKDSLTSVICVYLFHLRTRVVSSQSLHHFRTLLVTSLDHWPNEMDYWHLLSCIDASRLHWVNTRRFLFQNLSTHANTDRFTLPIGLALSAVKHEMGHLKHIERLSQNEETILGFKSGGYSCNKSSLVRRIRSTFETCLLYVPTYPPLWIKYLQFEMTHGNDSHQLKSIVYRALQACPHVKLLYTMGVRCMPEDVMSLLDLCLEKGLRLRGQLDEIQVLLKTTQSLSKAENVVSQPQ